MSLTISKKKGVNMPKKGNAMHNHLGSFHGIGRNWWVSQRLYMQINN